MKDYRQYRLTPIEGMEAVILGGIAAGLVISLFFPGIWTVGVGILIGCCMGPPVLRQKRRGQIARQMEREFRECLSMLLPVLRAGRSLEGAVQAVVDDLDPGELPCMIVELESMRNGLMLGIPLEELFLDLGERSGVEDIKDFAELLALRKRSKGDLAEAAEYTIQILTEKMEAEEELKTLLAQRRMEQRIMNMMPFVILGMLLLMSPDYLKPLYESFMGGLIRLSCLLLIGLGWLLSDRISRIRV